MSKWDKEAECEAVKAEQQPPRSLPRGAGVEEGAGSGGETTPLIISPQYDGVGETTNLGQGHGDWHPNLSK